MRRLTGAGTEIKRGNKFPGSWRCIWTALWKPASPETRKGIYRKAREREVDTVPGFQSAYEPPERPELVVDGGRETPEAAARRVMIKLAEKGYFRDD
jgi:Adenylylsulphate kinase